MKYVNAKDILPKELLESVQSYIQAGYLYVPAKEDEHKSWGEVSGYRKQLSARNAKIYEKYRPGASFQALSQEYHLAIETIKKIIYQK